MWARGTTVLEDVSVASWLPPRLGAGSVMGTAPSGYASYARVLHPVVDDHGDATTWAHVAAATGRTAHGLAQWHALVDSPDTHNFGDSRWPHGEPARGSLDPAPLAALCTLLAAHTATPDDCIAGLWEGWGWTSGAVRLTFAGPQVEVPSPFTSAELAAPKLTVPGRAYRLVAGPLSAVPAISAHDDGPFCWQSPNLLWPAARAWFVATEVDFDSTLVAGSAELVSAVLAHPDLEAWAVGREDSLAHDGDDVNPTNPRAATAPPPARGPLRRLLDRIR